MLHSIPKAFETYVCKRYELVPVNRMKTVSYYILNVNAGLLILQEYLLHQRTKPRTKLGVKNLRNVMMMDCDKWFHSCRSSCKIYIQRCLFLHKICSTFGNKCIDDTVIECDPLRINLAGTPSCSVKVLYDHR